jgi:hypothetical protein
VTGNPIKDISILFPAPLKGSADDLSNSLKHTIFDAYTPQVACLEVMDRSITHSAARLSAAQAAVLEGRMGRTCAVSSMLACRNGCLSSGHVKREVWLCPVCDPVIFPFLSLLRVKCGGRTHMQS